MKSPKLDGADLRKRRHSLGLTLEEASRGICSVAYLSLIEQGQRDASDRITELLFARMNAAESDAGTSVQVTALKVVGKVLNSAAANAEKNQKLKPETLFVSQAYVDEGPTLKRIKPRAMGRAYRINKRTSHITLTLGEKVTKAPKVVLKDKVKKVTSKVIKPKK